MKKQVILLTVALAMLVLGCSGRKDPRPATVIKATPVRVMEITARPFAEYLQITGSVAAKSHIKILVEEGGTIREIWHDKGSLVTAGQKLAVLENKVLEASFKEAQAALHLAQLDFKSKRVLYGKKAISENEYLASQYNLERAAAAFDLVTARYNKLTIIAPLNGLVNDRYYDVGAYVTPMTPLFDFMDNSVVKIKAGVAERFLNDIHIGTPVEVTFDALPDTRLSGQVDFVNQSIDPLSRTFTIEVRLPNPGRKLAPQMIANLKIERRSYPEAIVIPLDAILESETGKYVYITEGETARKIPVEIQAIYRENALVSGVSEGQRLIISGQQELTDGDPLNIVK